MAGNSNDLSREPAQDLAAKATSPGLAGATACAAAINTRAQVRETAGELARGLYQRRLADVPRQEMCENMLSGALALSLRSHV